MASSKKLIYYFWEIEFMLGMEDLVDFPLLNTVCTSFKDYCHKKKYIKLFNDK